MGDHTFEHVNLPEPMPDEDVARLLADPGFGRVFTDHMVIVDFTAERGWHDARLTAYAPLVLDPAAMVFHYSQEIFEGLKAYHQAAGGVAIFRPGENARRFNASAHRMAMPELPDGMFVEALVELLGADRRFVPVSEHQSLYLRPFMIATEPMIGVRPSAEYRFMVIASPVAGFFSAEAKPVTVWLGREFVRAAPGGTGAAKTGGNYAGTLLAQRQAAAEGCDQVVWLDAVERRYVEELGGMNIFFVMQGEDGGPTRLVTPELTGTLLPGVTRDSLLSIGRDLGLEVVEDRVDVEQWEKGCADGTISEVFACGTAAVVTAVGGVRHAAGGWTVGDGTLGPVTKQLREALLDVQYGRAPDLHGWMHPVV
jgi:branched-chain amino acid aminotransferase